jgi:hypothetical protein
MFGVLFDGMQKYAAGLQELGFKWLKEIVEDRVSYYSIMVDTVAQTLKAAGRFGDNLGTICTILVQPFSCSGPRRRSRRRALPSLCGVERGLGAIAAIRSESDKKGALLVLEATCPVGILFRTGALRRT